MKVLSIVTLITMLLGCVSFKPVDIGDLNGVSDTSSCETPITDICKARLFALESAIKYKNSVLENYDKNNAYDSWILNLVTLGIGAEVSSLHSDVVKTAAMGLGYQTARKTYRSIPFQLQLYTNAITSAQCVYDNSSRLQDGYADLAKIKQLATTLNMSLNALNFNPTLTNQLISTDLIDLGNYGNVKPKLERALELANQSSDVVEASGSTVVQTLQKIDITVLKRFNGQLPDINEISSQLREQIAANLELEEKGNVDQLSVQSIQKLVAPLSPPPYSHLKKPLADAINAMNSLSSMRVERYISDANLVKACAASL